ncbi:flagellar brake protein [Cellulomonas fengjieae]|uniref:PilZ domain-containing protein n=1 Tax=Cellulomonas fengjieae TaxID=2819978 RepID=A0ABS3SKM4_9CELL|nr:PilZ domain-containing protein [Cellulomonas fengjieae]MBO3086290.1 PilZ domain-containing protein [Cellulomonas fengjieae]QVI65670.1 PilZ domain-containing protein [Cellulomonas fengjieae]
MHDLAPCALSAGDRALSGYVAEFADGTMTIGIDADGFGTFRAGDDVQLLVLDEVRGEVRYDGWVAQAGATTVRVAELELTSTLQKRQVARVRIAQPCVGTVELPDGDGRAITFVVLDISAHGMRISTTAPLAEHERVSFGFPIGDRDVALVAEVLRSQQTDSGTTLCGCRFVGLHERDADTLFRFVMQTQGAQRRTRLQA